MSPSREPGLLAAREGAGNEVAPRRFVVAGPAVALLTTAMALLAGWEAGVPLRDPDHVVGARLLLVVCLVIVLIGLDIAVRAWRRCGKRVPSRTTLQRVRRERWTRRRVAIVGSALASFYLTYLAYRNLKSLVPLLRPGDLFDRQLAEVDRALFGGQDPAALMHEALGTAVTTEVLSVVYVLFLLFVPLSIALALVFSPDLRRGLFYATAVSINWVLGAVSYILLPSLGPIYATPGEFADLPGTAASELQRLLLSERLEFLRDPAATDAAQSIAAFASLHVSIIFTAAVAAHLLGLGRHLRIALWTLLALTTASTIHLGWHYVVDDLGGVALGVAAIGLALRLTGFQPSSSPTIGARAEAGAT